MPFSSTRTPSGARLAVLSLATLAALTACGGRAPAAVIPPPAPARPAPRFANGDSVVAVMHRRYTGKWYNTLAFRQKTSRLLPTGKWDVQTWYESMKLPGKLRIDFDPVSGGNGVMYARDSQFVASSNKVIRGEPGINDLLLLGFDVYGNPPARTAALLRKQGFDLNQVHEDTFEGRPMIVVGAAAGDLRRKQFWVDADRMLFMRLLDAAPRDSTKVQDIRFVNYEPVGTAWIAPRVEVLVDGKLIFAEDYSDVRPNLPLHDSIFDPTPWKNPRHWVR